MLFRIHQQHFNSLMTEVKIKTCHHVRFNGKLCDREITAFWMVTPTKIEEQKHTYVHPIGVCSTHDKVMWRRKDVVR